jgi:hypothetical protein
VASRTKGFASKLAVERLAESLPMRAPAPAAPMKAVPLRLAPLLAPYRNKGRLALRIERVPQLARLTHGRNNGDGSWSLGLDEVEGLEYVGPDSALERPSLAVRIIALEQDGATLAVLDLPVVARDAEALSAPVDNDYLQRLSEELKTARAALAEREHELAQIRHAPPSRADADIERRLAAADATAALAAEQAQALWRQDEAARFAAAEARWQTDAAQAVADAQAQERQRAAAALAQAERGWKDRLAAAETRARNAEGTAAAGIDTEIARLRDKLTAADSLLRRRDDDLARLRQDAAAATQRGQGDIAAAQAQGRQKAADELAVLAARLGAAERALSDSRGAQAARDSELKTLRDERAALQPRLAERERVPAGVPQDAVARQIDAALATARTAWKSEEAGRLAVAERQWRAAAPPPGASPQDVQQQIDTALATARTAWQTQDAVRETELKALRDDRAALQARVAERERPPAGVPPDAVTRQIDAALAAARTAWKTEEAAHLAAVEVQARAAETLAHAAAAEEIRGLTTRCETAERALAAPPKAPPPPSTAQIDSAVASARTAWKTEEAARLAQAEEKWRSDAAAALARVTARAEESEIALAAARAAPPPPPQVRPAAPSYDQAFIDGLRGEIEELRSALAGREVEVAHLRLSLDSRRAAPEPRPKFFPEPRPAPERDVRVVDPRRSNRKLAKEIVFVFAVVAVLAVGVPFAVPYLPYAWQENIQSAQISLFGAQPAATGTATAAPHRAGGAAAPTATVARAVNVRATASAAASIVTRLKRGDTVSATETHGNWTHIKTSTADGWVFSSYLKK